MSSADGRFAFALAGAAIGAYFGYPGLGFAAGSFIGGLIFPPEGQDVEGPRLQDLNFSDSKYGTPIPILYGTMRMGVSYVWATDVVERVKKEDSGGKGGGGSTTTRTYTYFGNFMCLTCESPSNFPVEVVEKIFGDKKIIADFSNETSPIIAASLAGLIGEAGAFTSGQLRINLGNEDQLPDPLVETNVGVGLTPAYRGVCTIVFDDMPLQNFGNRIPQIEAVVSTQGTDIFPTIQMPQATESTGDFFTPDGVSIFKSGNDDGSVIINSQTQTFIRARGDFSLQSMNAPGVDPAFHDGLVYEGWFDVDASGRGTTEGGFLFQGSSVGLHNVITGKGIARSFVNNVMSGGADRVYTRFAGSRQQYLFSEGRNSLDRFWTWHSPFPLIWPEGNYTAPDFGLLEQIGGTWATDGGGATTIASGLDSAEGLLGVAIVDNGDVWVTTVRDGGNREISKLRLGGGVLTTWDLGAGLGNDLGLGYERTTNSLFFNNGTTWYKWFIDTETLDPRTITSTTPHFTESVFRQGSFGGEIIIGIQTFGPDVQRLDLVNMTVVKTYDLNGDFLPSEGNVMRPFYVPNLNAVILSPNSSGNPVIWYFLDRETVGGVTLKSILDNLDTRVGYVPDTDTDASPHSSTLVPGWIVGGRTQVKTVKQSLSELYQFLVVEEEHIVKHPLRGTASVDALVSDDLGASSDRKETGQPKLEEVRSQELELPRQVEYEFREAAFDYQAQLVSARRIQEIVNTERVIKKTFPVNLTVDEAQQRVEQALHQSWMDRTRYKFSLRPEKMLLSPGDVVTINHNGSGHVVTLIEVEFGANNLVECVGIGFAMPVSVLAAEADTITANIANLNALTEGGSSGAFIPGVIEEVLNPTTLVLMDIPLIADSFDTYPNSGVSVSAKGINGGQSWDGATILKGTSPGDSSNFTDWVFYNKIQEGVQGTTVDTLGEIPTQNNQKGQFQTFTTLDTINTVTVSFDESVSLASVTFQQLVQEQNAFLIGDEIVQVMTIVDNGDGSWTFSNILRGRKGTEENDIHTAFERVTQLDIDKMQIQQAPISEVDQEFFYKPITINGSTSSPLVTPHTSTGRIIAPRPVGHVSGVKSGSDWSITYKRRGRFQSNLLGSDLIPLAQSSHNYEVDILLEDQTTIIRTITTTATANGSVVTIGATVDDPITVLYDQLDIEADFGETPIVSHYPLYRLMCKIYQLESLLPGVGRGFVKTGRIEAFPDPIADDASFSDVTLLLQGNNLAFRDKSGDRFPTTVDTGLTFATGSFWDGTSQYGSGIITFPTGEDARISRNDFGSQFNLGSDDFTIEAWVREDHTHQGAIVTLWNDSADREWYFGFTEFVRAFFFRYTTNGSTIVDREWSIPAETGFGLAHYAVVRNGNNLYILKDGVREATFDVTGITIFSGGNADLVIGAEHDSSDTFQGDLDSLRITTGLARYTATTYDIPSTRFANN